MSAENLLTKTLIVWWRYGKEHGKEEFRVNPPEVVNRHLKGKVDHFRSLPEESWRWWKVSDDLIIERWDDSPGQTGPDTRIYYLLNRGVTVIENVHCPPPDDRWKWYIHISDFLYSSELETWRMKDLFCDVVVEEDNHTYHLYDLPDLAQALDVGLICSNDSREILKRIDWVVSNINNRAFPFPEIMEGREACHKLGW